MAILAKEAVVICTKDRPGALRQCLASVLQQRSIPEVVLVVDSSADSRSREIAAEHPEVSYLASGPGLPRQRNVGVRWLPTHIEVVHFIDDDVVVEPQYFEVLGKALRAEHVQGVGGLITNVSLNPPRLPDRLFLQDSSRRGRLLPSGRNVMSHGFTAPARVDWLSGCSMTFRRELLLAHPFNESVGTGEDVEYALSLGSDARFLVLPTARLEHRQSPVNRFTAAEWSAHYVVLRHRWIREHPARFSPLAFWWSAVGEVLFAAIGTARRRRGCREQLRAVSSAYWTLLRGGQVGPTRDPILDTSETSPG